MLDAKDDGEFAEVGSISTYICDEGHYHIEIFDTEGELAGDLTLSPDVALQLMVAIHDQSDELLAAARAELLEDIEDTIGETVGNA